MARYSFLNMYGEKVGLTDTDDLEEALKDAQEFEYQIYDNKLNMFAWSFNPVNFYFRFTQYWVLAMVKEKET